MSLRVVVTGATGNVGTSVLQALSADPEVDSILGVARRAPRLQLPKVDFAEADVSRDSLEGHFRGADAVIHLAWLIQPGRDEATTRATNVEGSRRTFEAVVAAGVPSLVYASSVGAYSPGPKDRAVDESWPTDGIRPRSTRATRPRSRPSSTGSSAPPRRCAACDCARA